MTREEKELNLFIGKTKNDEFVFLENAFDNGDFKGLCGNTFRFYTEFAKENMEDDYYYSDEGEYLFCEYIKYSHDHDTSFNEWVEMAKDENPNGGCFDDSYSGEEWLEEAMQEASERDDYDYEFSDCCGGGRMFDNRYLDKDFYEWVNEENLKTLIDYYNEYEVKKEGN